MAQPQMPSMRHWRFELDVEGIGWLTTDPAGLRKRLGGRWLSTDFKAGDAGLFQDDPV